MIWEAIISKKMQKITSKCKQRSMSPLMNEPQAARTINIPKVQKPNREKRN